MLRFLQLLLILFFPLFLFGEIKPKPSLHIKKTTSKIVIDGELNEVGWQQAETAKDFFQNFPADTFFSITKTEAMVTYDDAYFYVAAICYDDIKSDYVIQSLKRDFSYPINDAFAVYIDPFYDKTNGFCFGVNPIGVQREGVLESGGDYGVTTDWDNRWFSEVKRYDGKWIVEMAIPFKSIRYKKEITAWGINFSRNDLKRNENSSWAAVPRNFNIASLAYTGDLIWDTPPDKAGVNSSLIPYTIGSASDDFVNDSVVRYKLNAGVDAKVAVTSSLNLDLTFNPDFSQVEADKQQTNLTRFSLFYPEKRQFFIENSDLFSQFGSKQVRPFFSRQIGLFNGSAVPIIAGARLSGKINRNWRIGAMNVQTARAATLKLEAQNHTVVAFQRKIFSRSNLAGIFVNRQGFNNTEINSSDYNRIAGLDYNLASENNKWSGKFFYHHSFTKNNLSLNYAHASSLIYNTRSVIATWNHEYVGKNYAADAGFVPLLNNYNAATNEFIKFSYWRFEPQFEYRFYPRSKIINSHGPLLYYSAYLDSAFQPTESLYKFTYTVKFNNTSVLTFEPMWHFSKLIFATDITHTGNALLPAAHYHYNMLKMDFQSDQRKKLNGKISLKYGEFYNGSFTAGDGELNFRMQPWGVFAIACAINNIRLPSPYSVSTLVLLGPKVELSFTKSVFFTTFIQYNTQIDNVNINSRLQWRFKPMSDLFIVYTDNYDSHLGKKNRAIVLKFVYWFSI